MNDLRSEQMEYLSLSLEPLRSQKKGGQGPNVANGLCLAVGGVDVRCVRVCVLVLTVFPGFGACPESLQTGELARKKKRTQLSFLIQKHMFQNHIFY